jgi:hypothetical protein
MTDSLPADEKVEDWLCYTANDAVLSTEHQREMSALTLRTLARLRRERDLYKFQAETNAQTVIRQANEIRDLHDEIDELEEELEDAWGET